MTDGRYGVLNNDVIQNVIVADISIGREMGAIYLGDLPVGIGDTYDRENNVFQTVGGESFSAPAPMDDSPSEMRRKAYKTMRSFLNKAEALLPWEGEPLTVDEANTLWMDYMAEGNAAVAGELQILIVAAKTYIRGIYPEKEA